MRYVLRSPAFKATILLSTLLVFSAHTYATGALDATFGMNGRAVTFIGSLSYAAAGVLQSDGKIVVAGGYESGGTLRDTVLVRYNPDGSLDTGFGNGGKVFASLSPRDELITSVALQPDGKIVVAGSVQPFDGITLTDFLVARFTADGGLDTGFGTNGVFTLNQGSVDVFNAVAVQSDGRIVAAGRASANASAAVIRLTSAGQLDVTFASNGVLFLDLPNFTEENFSGVALLPNGRILAGGLGKTTDPQFPGEYSNLLVLLEPFGGLVDDFGLYHGIAASGTSRPAFDFDMVVQPDGKILTVGTRTVRFLSNGQIDPTVQSSAVGGTRVGLRSDGKFVISGNNEFLNYESRLYTGDGLIIGRAKNLVGNDILVQPDDKPVFIYSSGSDFTVTRLLSITSRGTRLTDYDRDDITDLAVFRPGNNTLYVLRSTDNNSPLSIMAGTPVTRALPDTFGEIFYYWSASASPDDPAYFHLSSTQAVTADYQWGLSSDVPVGGDFDRDGFSEFAVFRPSNGTWYLTNDPSNQLRAVRFGQAGDKPVPADYDYDGVTDIAAYRPSNGTWYILKSSDGSVISQQFGLANDIPLTGDFDGDGRADFVVYRPSNGTWYLLQTTAGFRAMPFGLATDQPVPGDYDGDGRHDIAVFRQGNWYILGSTRGFYTVQWGTTNDEPVALRYAY
jgi:uncharacterized delta-60 repeat protein